MTRKARNILFIMYDQLRFDYLSCAGHKHLHTPNFDRVAAKGVRFSRAYVQSPVCGASRMSFYTGRYVHSHGAQQNGYPLKVGEQTLGDHLRKNNMECWLIGKTHMTADAEGMARLGLSPESAIGARLAECGFDAYIRDDQLWAQGPDGYYDEKRSPYNAYLNEKGYQAENPWATFANAGIDDNGNAASGFLMMHADKPANIREEDSETAWLTSRTLDFMATREGQKTRWLAHISYIKPHWPYIVPAPYHNMYGPEHIQTPVRDERERQNPHPVLRAYQNSRIGQAFARDEVRDLVIPAYMGLIKQCDDHLGRILDYLDETGQAEQTMIVLTSDHGDYLGDHWLGEKDMFHDPSVKIPLIIYDPSPAADATRGTICDELIEAIDLAATFIEVSGGPVPDHIVEGRSILPWLHGETPENWRDFAISEYDFSGAPARAALGLAPRDCRLFMVADKRWKMIHVEGGLRPMLFDLQTDPQEFADLGDEPDYADTRAIMYERLGRWARRMSQRTTVSEQQLLDGGNSGSQGILIGVFDGSEVPEDFLSKYNISAGHDYTS